MTLICFDLDGTLLDPLAGFHCAAQKVCDEFHQPCPTPQQIAPLIGLDMVALFEGFPTAPERVAAVARFWEVFGEACLQDQQAQEGIPLLLARLKRQGHGLVLVAGQPLSQTRRVLHHLDLNLVFEHVAGPPAGATWSPKRAILDGLAAQGVLREGGIFIGDRGSDIEGGRAHGLRTTGVAYGYGTRDELTAAKADLILDSVPALDAWLSEVAAGPEIHDPFSRSE